RQLARRSALNARAREGMVHVIDSIEFQKPSTSSLLGLLKRLDLAAGRVLILTDGSKPSVYLSARNAPGLSVLPFDGATAYDILHAHVLVIERAALDAVAAPADTERG